MLKNNLIQIVRGNKTELLFQLILEAWGEIVVPWITAWGTIGTQGWLGLRPANERRRYFVTTSLIGWAQA